MNKHLIQLKILQIVVDGLLILGAFALAYLLRIGFYSSTDFPFNQYILIGLITTPITLFFMFFARTYKLSQQVMSVRHMQRIAFVAIENVAVFMVLYYFAFRNFFSRLILVYIFLLTFLFVYFWHRIFRWILAKSAEREVGVYRTLIIGANRPAEEIIKHLLKTKSHIKPVAIIDAFGSGKSVIAGVPVVGKMNVFERAIAQHDIDHILQVDHHEQTLNIINYALSNNIKYIMPPELLGIFQGHQMLEEIEGQPFLKVYRNKKWWDRIW
ncbi:hypothetical protein KAR91_82295 [Candidatus Pacearchaeota archaeon]|nr:hypothetical protein [Candidatus Pacearchaeota archaeon]